MKRLKTEEKKNRKTERVRRASLEGNGVERGPGGIPPLVSNFWTS
jgi:hypothetical protein